MLATSAVSAPVAIGILGCIAAVAGAIAITGGAISFVKGVTTAWDGIQAGDFTKFANGVSSALLGVMNMFIGWQVVKTGLEIVKASFAVINASLNPHQGSSGTTFDSMKKELSNADMIYKKNPVTGVEEPYMKMVTLDDGSKLMLRKDFDGFSHGGVNYWNLELHGNGKIIENLHVYVDEFGNITEVINKAGNSIK